MTGVILIGVTERGSFKKYSEAVLRLCTLTYSEFTVHMQSQLKVGSLFFVGTKTGLSYDLQFFS